MDVKPQWFYLFFTICSTSFISSVAGGDAGGLTVIPMPDLVNSTLIYYKANDRGSVQNWTTIVDGFLDKYHKTGSDLENRIVCSYDYGPARATQVCDVSLDDFEPCTRSNEYNYGRSAPCVFIKLNETLDWTPQPYNDTSDLPQDMPEDLKNHINVVVQSGRPEANTVWMTCEGETPADKENIGPLQYHPRRGFPSYYFPFNNEEGYLSPLVAVLFERPMIGILINVECKVWARNIKHDQDEHRGSVHFELMIDN